MYYFSYDEMPALSGNCLKWKADPIFWDCYMHILMYSIYTPYFQNVILFFTYLSLFPSWYIMAAKCLNVYICPAVPSYNFTLSFLSSWVLITVLCTVCQTYVTLMIHGKMVLTHLGKTDTDDFKWTRWWNIYNNGSFVVIIMPLLHWKSIVRCIFNTHSVSGVVSTSVIT